MPGRNGVPGLVVTLKSVMSVSEEVSRVILCTSKSQEHVTVCPGSSRAQQLSGECQSRTLLDAIKDVLRQTVIR